MLKLGQGRMVFTSSVAGSYGLTNHEAIAAAKGGIEAMVRSAASTYWTRTSQRRRTRSHRNPSRCNRAPLDAIREASVGMIPLKRINEPEEIARSMHWLLTDAPDNLTGKSSISTEACQHFEGRPCALRSSEEVFRVGRGPRLRRGRPRRVAVRSLGPTGRPHDDSPGRPTPDRPRFPCSPHGLSGSEAVG